MKLIVCNGKRLEVRDAGPVIFRLDTTGIIPIKLNGYHLMNEDKAHEVLRELLLLGIYSGGKIIPGSPEQ